MNAGKRELDDLALQYLGDELSEDARAAFEARLLEDQAAREAVAAGMECLIAVRAVFAEDAALVTRRESAASPAPSRAWWRVALACSVLAGLILVTQLMESVNRQHAAQPPADGADANLAIAWNDTRSDWPTALADASNASEAEVDCCAGDILAQEEEFGLPTWMLAAVTDTSNASEPSSAPEVDREVMLD